MPVASRPWRLWTLSVLLASVPLMLSIDYRVKALVPAALFVTGLWLTWTQPATRRCYRAAWPVVWPVLLFMACIGWNVLVHDLGWRPVDRAAHLVLYLVVAAAFTCAVRAAVVWTGFGVCALVLGAVCVVQHHVQGIARAYGLNGGPSASIELATVLLGLVLVALARLLGTRVGRVERAVLVAAVLVGSYGALLTQSRGPLLAFLPALVLLLFWHARRRRSWRLVAWTLLVAGVGVVLAGRTTHVDLVGRFAAIAPEVASYDEHRDVRGPVRERLEMWRVALQATREHPWLGVGTGSFHDYVAAEIAVGRANPAIGRYNQPHNQYLESAAAAGIPGLLVLLAVLLVPLGYFLRRLRAQDDAIVAAALAGGATIILYALCGLTDSVFYRVMPLSFYFFIVPGMALWIARRESLPVVDTR